VAGIVTRDEVIAALSTGRTSLINKASIGTQLAGGFASLWRANGRPAQGAIPGAAAICTAALTGALDNAIPTPTAGQRNALLVASAAFANAGTLAYIVDRLAHMGGLSGTLTTAQTVNVSIVSLAGSRCRADYADCRWWLEIYTDIGTTGATATISYTDSGGNARTTTVTGFGGASPANRAGRIFPIIPATATPLPIASVQSVTLSVSTGTAGSFGVTATRDLSALIGSGVANFSVGYDWAALGAPTVHQDACLAITMLTPTTTTGVVVGHVVVGTG